MFLCPFVIQTLLILEPPHPPFDTSSQILPILNFVATPKPILIQAQEKEILKVKMSPCVKHNKIFLHFILYFYELWNFVKNLDPSPFTSSTWKIFETYCTQVKQAGAELRQAQDKYNWLG